MHGRFSYYAAFRKAIGLIAIGNAWQHSEALMSFVETISIEALMKIGSIVFLLVWFYVAKPRRYFY